MSSSEINARISAAAVNAESSATPVEVRLDAARFPRLRDVAPAEAVRTIEGFIRLAALASARNISDEAIGVMADMLHAELVREFPRITLEEVGRGIRKGVFGQLGEFYGLSASSLFRMVAAYVDSVEVVDALQAEEQCRRRSEAEEYEARVRFLERFPDYAKAIAGKQ